MRLRPKRTSVHPGGQPILDCPRHHVPAPTGPPVLHPVLRSARDATVEPMITIVFEDAAADRLGVLSAARPACDLLIGAMTLVEALGRFGAVRRAPRPHLAAYLAALAGRRIAVWGGDADAGPDRPAELHRGHVALAVNARVVPHRDNLFALRTPR